MDKHRNGPVEAFEEALTKRPGIRSVAPQGGPTTGDPLLNEGEYPDCSHLGRYD